MAMVVGLKGDGNKDTVYRDKTIYKGHMGWDPLFRRLVNKLSMQPLTDWIWGKRQPDEATGIVFDENSQPAGYGQEFHSAIHTHTSHPDRMNWI
jgi:hypothetical protein